MFKLISLTSYSIGKKMVVSNVNRLSCVRKYTSITEVIKGTNGLIDNHMSGELCCIKDYSSTSRSADDILHGLIVRRCCYHNIHNSYPTMNNLIKAGLSMYGAKMFMNKYNIDPENPNLYVYAHMKSVPLHKLVWKFLLQTPGF